MSGNLRVAFSSLKVHDWPQRDRTLWQNARTKGGFLDDAGLAADWRPSTIVTAEYHYGTFLWWLRERGSLDANATPEARATPKTIRAFIEAYSQGHATSSVAGVVQLVADMVRVTATDADVQWIYEAARRLKRKAIPVKPLSHRMCPTTDLASVAEALMERGAALLQDDPVKAALFFRDGLMILAETCLPLRRKNCAGLRLGHTLLRDEDRYRVALAPEAMKNGQPFEGWYPAWLTPRLDFYCERVRPILLGSVDDEGWLWLGRRGEPLQGATISSRLREVFRQTLGVPLSLHAFRHSATTDIAIHAPAEVGIVKSVLGHASPLSARFYDLSSNMEASARYQKVMESMIREDLGPSEEKQALFG
jgi:integrase